MRRFETAQPRRYPDDIRLSIKGLYSLSAPERLCDVTIDRRADIVAALVLWVARLLDGDATPL